MFEIKVSAVPRESLCGIRPDALVPTEVADGQGIVKIPVEPFPMLGGIGNCRIEVQPDDILATDIFDSHAHAGRIEVQELYRAGCGQCGAGGRTLCMEERGKHKSGQEKEGDAMPFDRVDTWRTGASCLRRRMEHGRYPPKMGRILNMAGYR